MTLLTGLVGLFGLFLVLLVVWEGFETIILPRSITRGFRLTRGFYRALWPAVAMVARCTADSRRQQVLAYFGPLSLPLLLVFWACLLIAGFGLMQYATPHALTRLAGMTRIQTALYESGVTFFTLGYGDVLPHTNFARLLTVAESGVGFGFLAVVIGYLPVLYQAFSRREAIISLLDARASSPPSATEMLRRHAERGQMASMTRLLADWERWASELLESHLSYPVLMYYRSQHDHQSWLSALTAIMDTCALLLVGVPGSPAWQGEVQWQARMTLAMCRHAVIDLAYVVNISPAEEGADRLPPGDLLTLRQTLAGVGLPLCDGPEDDAKLAEMRGLYEPYVTALGSLLLFRIPAWLPSPDIPDNWQTSAWDKDTQHF